MSRYHRRDIDRKMSSKSFDDYAATESGLPNEETPSSNYIHGGRKPFSPIEELEEPLSDEMASLAAAASGSMPHGDDRGGGRAHHQGYHDNSRRATTTSPRTSTSPKQPSLSPQSHSSGSSGHSSPRSPPTGYAHPPPPTSQPPPLPPTVTPSRGALSGGGPSKGRLGHVGMDHYGSRTSSGGGGAYEMRQITHQDQHHKSHNRRVGGVGKSQHGSDSHIPFQQQQQQQQQQHMDNSRVPSHSMKVSRQSFHVASSSEGNGVYGSSMVNTRVIPSKKYATSISDHTPPTDQPLSAPQQQVDYYSKAALANNESLINDPGDRVPPSGASSPSSTPNSTLSKIHHVQMQQDVLLQASSSDSRLLRTDSQSSADSGMASLEASKSDIVLYQESGSGITPNGVTKHHVGGGGGGVGQNMKRLTKTPGVGKEREKQSSLASVYNKYHPVDSALSMVAGGDTARVLQHPRSSGSSSSSSSSVAARAAMFNLNLNNSGNTTTAASSSDMNSPSQPSSLQQGNKAESSSPHHASSTKSNSKGTKAPSPKSISRSSEGVPSGESNSSNSSQTGKTGVTEDNVMGGGYHDNNSRRRMEGLDSRSSSIEELSQINEKEVEEQSEGEEEVDAGRHALLIKPEATKSSTMSAAVQQQQHHMTGNYGKIPGPHPHQQQGPPPPSYPSSSSQQAPPPPPSAAAAQMQHAHHHPSHHHSGGEPHHPPPPPYPPYMFTTSLSQGAASLSQGLSQGGGGAPQLSQGLPPTYPAYDQHYPGRSEIAMYPPPPPPSMAGAKYSTRGAVGMPRQHHHISPPHGSQQYEGQPQSQAPPYPGAPGTQQQPKHQSVSYQMSHDSRTGVHMMGGGQQLPPHLLSHDIQLHHRPVPYLVSSNIVSLAHDAAGKGDINTLHHMISKGEIDAYGFTEHYFTLAHKAANHGRLSVLKFLIKDGNLPLVALQQPDDSLTTPAMLAIQGGHLECLQWLVEEGKVPIEVRDTGGETLVHHAAYHGQVKCLEWLLATIPKDEKKDILDELGVTPAHFAAQGGHLDCLLLLMDRGYSIIHADKDNQRPLDWADAMGQYICVRFLIMYEACWSLSREITQMQKKNAHLQETIALMEQEHQLAISKMQQTHDDRIAKMREHYVDFTHSILTLKDSTPNSASNQTGGGGASSSGSGTSKSKGQQPARKAPGEPPPTSSSQQRRGRPPVPPDTKKRSGRGGASGGHDGKKERGAASHDGPGDHDQHEGNIDYRTATPQEVLEKRVTSVTQRMTASREARKHRGGGHVTRTFSPLTPIIQRLYSGKTDEDSKGSERSIRTQRQTEERRSAPKVKFSTTVTEYPHDYGRYDHSDETRTGKSSGHSPAHSASGHSGSSSGDHGNNRGGGGGKSSVHSPSHGPSSNSSVYNSGEHSYNSSDGYSKSERRPGS